MRWHGEDEVADEFEDNNTRDLFKAHRMLHRELEEWKKSGVRLALPRSKGGEPSDGRPR